MPNDPFVADQSSSADGKYSPEKFYTQARDTKGQSTTIGNLHLPPSTVDSIADFIAKGKVPEYGNVTKACRDFVVHGYKLKEAQILDPDFARGFSWLVKIREADRVKAEIDSANEAVDHVEKMFLSSKTELQLSKANAYCDQLRIECPDPEIEERLRDMQENFSRKSYRR